MTIRLYFETLSPGFHARLDAKYRMQQKSLRAFNTVIYRARLETGNIFPVPADMLKVPAGQAR